MNVKVMDYDRNIIDGLSPDIKDFNGLIENNSPTANFLSQDIKQTNSEIVPPIRMPSQEFNQNQNLLSYRSKSLNNFTARSGKFQLGSFT